MSADQVWPPPPAPPAPDPIDVLAARLGHPFRDGALLLRALTHRSWLHERGGASSDHYERLELLGDAVLGLVTAEWLYARYPDSAEGELAKLKSYLVSATTLERHAQRLGLGEAIRLGVGEERSGGRRKRSILADSLEAIFGAAYLDGGLAAAREVVEPLLEAGLAEQDEADPDDAKTALQELAQARGWPLPRYRVVAEEGPDHRKSFTVECQVETLEPVQGDGRSKKVAERHAAAEALRRLRAGSA